MILTPITHENKDHKYFLGVDSCLYTKMPGPFGNEEWYICTPDGIPSHVVALSEVTIAKPKSKLIGNKNAAKKPEDKLTAVLHMRLHPQAKERWQNAADKAGIPLSRFVFDLVESGLKSPQ